MSNQKFLYKTVGPQKEVKYHRNTVELQQFFNRAKPVIREAMKNNVYLDGYKIFELDEPIELKTPQLDDEVTIQNVKCKVLNVYNNVCTVLTDAGTAVVGLKDMQFVVNPGTVGIDRQYPLQTRNY